MFWNIGKKFSTLFLIILFLAASFGPVSLPEFLRDISQKQQGKNIVDKIYLAKQNPNVVDNFRFGIREAQAALDPAELEYAVDTGPVNGSTSANYVYASFFNPSGSGRTTVIKRIAVRANAVAGANYVNLTVRRTIAPTPSGGTQITAENIPKKHNDSSNPVTEVRHTDVAVTFAGVTASRIMGQRMPGAAGQFHSYRDITFSASDEKLVIQPGEGIALYQEVGGGADQRIRIYVEWEEVASAPTAQNEFLFAFPSVESAVATSTAFSSFFNPAASGKTAIVKRIWFGTETCGGAATYTNNIVLRRTTAHSGGTAITASDVPKKHTGSANSVMEFRHTGATVTVVGTADARLGFITPCAVAGQPHGFMQIDFNENDEKLILQPGKGIALITEATANAFQLTRMIIEWQEVASGSTPASQGEYIWASPRIEVAAALGANFYTFFNPSGSGKTAVVKRLVIRNNADNAAAYSAFNFQRIATTSGGILIAAADLPKKHASTSDSVTQVRWCGAACGTAITATYSGHRDIVAGGISDSGFMKTNGPGAIAQVIGQRELVFGNNEKLVLQQGEGIGFYLNYLAGDIDHYVKILIEWQEVASGSTPASQGEYLIDIGPVDGSTSNPYYYASFFNPGASGKTAIVKRVSIRVDWAATGASYIPITLRRTTSASGGTQIIAANIPKKHASTTDSVMDIRRTGGTAPTLAGTADSRLTSVQTPGAAGTLAAPSLTGYKELVFKNDERIILQQGQGFTLYQEAAGTTGLRVKILIEWQEVASGSTPASQGEYLMTVGPVNGSLSVNYVYSSLFNPSGSNKNYVVKRIGIRANRSLATTTPIYIPATIRRTTSASAGTQITAANIPKKHASTTDTTAEIRHTNVTVAFANATTSRLLGITVPGVVNQSYGDYESEIVYGDELILKPSEGIALYQEAAPAAGDINIRFRFNFEWSESDIAAPSLTLELSTSTVDLGVLTPGVAVTATSTATVIVTGATTGYNLQVKRDDATSTLDLSTDGTIDFPDYTAWDPTGNGNATTTPGSTFSFRVQSTTTGTTSNYNSTWWGANDTDGTAKYAGFPSGSQIIMNCNTGGTCNDGTTYTQTKYRANSPLNQKTGSYNGTITYTALTN